MHIARLTVYMLFYWSVAGHAEPLPAEPLRVATASNFSNLLAQIAHQFEDGKRIQVISGSSGKLYAKILHGAPYDLFLSADSTKPALLHAQNQSSAPRTYAVGRLALWSPQHTNSGKLYEAFKNDRFNSLAVANPRLAPYGIAAKEVLTKLAIQPEQLIVGENISQTYQFVHAGSVQAGLVAYAQVYNAPAETYQLLPSALHLPIEQQAVVLKRAQHKPMAHAFLEHLLSEPVQNWIRNKGYPAP